MKAGNFRVNDKIYGEISAASLLKNPKSGSFAVNFLVRRENKEK
jgi:hypothetical protein